MFTYMLCLYKKDFNMRLIMGKEFYDEIFIDGSNELLTGEIFKITHLKNKIGYVIFVFMCMIFYNTFYVFCEKSFGLSR